jgi:hypothetical protein
MVSISRRMRRWLSGWLALTLLFTQLATAAHACPKQDATARGAAIAAMAETVAMGDCAGAPASVMDADQPNLCKAHCEAGAQSANNADATLDVPPGAPMAPPLVRVLDPAQAGRRAAAMPATLAAGPPPGTTPLYLTLHVLRD